MKTNHYWALLKLETIFFARFLFFPAIFAAETVVFSGLPLMDVTMFAAMLALFGGIAIFWSYGFLFQERGMGFRGLGFRCGEPNRGLRTLEFPFSRAFDRGTLFGVRSFWFFASSAIPLLAFVVASLWHPNRVIQVNHGTNSPSAAVQAYYLAHFPGAMRQTSDLTPDLPNLHGLVPQPHVFRASIVLPHAQTELAVIVLWAGVIAAALYQSLMLGTLRYKWCQRLLPFALAFIGPGAVMAISVLQFARESHHHVSTDQPQALDLAQAWVIRNPLVFGLIGAAMIGLALRFSRRRFVRQEVLS